MLKTLTGLIRLGSAESQTRAEAGVEKAELNPIYHYDDDGGRVGLQRLGAAGRETRATGPGP